MAGQGGSGEMRLVPREAGAAEGLAPQGISGEPDHGLCQRLPVAVSPVMTGLPMARHSKTFVGTTSCAF